MGEQFMIVENPRVGMASMDGNQRHQPAAGITFVFSVFVDFPEFNYSGVKLEMEHGARQSFVKIENSRETWEESCQR